MDCLVYIIWGDVFIAILLLPLCPMNPPPPQLIISFTDLVTQGILKPMFWFKKTKQPLS